MAVLRNYLISSLFDNLNPAPTVIVGCRNYLQGTMIKDSNSYDHHRDINDPKNATFVMLIDLDASSPEKGVSFIDHVMIPFICILFVLKIWIHCNNVLVLNIHRYEQTY